IPCAGSTTRGVLGNRFMYRKIGLFSSLSCDVERGTSVTSVSRESVRITFVQRRCIDEPLPQPFHRQYLRLPPPARQLPLRSSLPVPLPGGARRSVAHLARPAHQ